MCRASRWKMVLSDSNQVHEHVQSKLYSLHEMAAYLMSLMVLEAALMLQL